MKNSITNSFWFFVCFALIFSVTPAGSWAATYYVANGGNNCSPPTCGTIENPFATPQYAANLVNAGDTVYLKRGDTFDGFWLNRSGEDPETGAGRITFSAYGTGTEPIIEGTNLPWQNGNNSIIALEVNWYIIENLKIQNITWAGIWFGDPHQTVTGYGNNNIIRNCEITNVGEGMVVKGNNNLIINNYIHDLHMVNNTQGGDDDFGAVAFRFNNFSGNEVAYNRMINCIAESYDYGVDGGAVEWWIPGGESNNNSFHHNYAENTSGGIEIGGRNPAKLDGAYIYSNVFVNCWRVGWIHNNPSTTFGVDVYNYYYQNNTFVETGTRYSPYVIGFGGQPNPEIHIKNNIFYITNPNIVSMLNYRDFSPADRDSNIYWMPYGRLNFTLEPTELNVDPKFVDIVAKDFHLQPDSPAIDAGVNLGYTFDFDGNSIPQGDGFDIGAYEFMSGSSEDNVPPSPPTGFRVLDM